MKRLVSFFFHLGAIGLICLIWLPIARAYYTSVPAIGSDFLQFPTYVSYIKDNFQLPPASWKYIWYSGFPLVFDMAWLHMYLTLPLTAFLSVVDASRLYLIATMFAQLAFSYFLLYELCRNRFVSLTLTIALASSINFYHGLFDGGTATFSATRMFLPLTLLFLVKYFEKQNYKFLLLAGLAIGLSSLGHSGSLFLIILGPALLFFLFWQDEQTSIFSLRKISGVGILTLIGLLVGGVTLYPIVEQIFTHPGFAQFGLETKIHEDALTGIYDRTNPFLIFLFFFLSVWLLVRRKINQVPQATPFLVLVIYVLVSGVLFLIGHHPLSQALGPPRIWWIFSLALAGLIALFWQSLFLKEEGKWLTRKNPPFFLSLLLFIPIFFSFNLPDFKEKLDKNTSQAGYPSNVQQAVINGERKTIEKAIIPDWMDTQSLDYRYYEINPGVETWWSSIFPLPLIKGYYHLLDSKPNDWLYWVDNTLLGEYVWHFGVPAEIAKQHALFLIDWYAVRYLELGGLPLADYLENDSEIIQFKAKLNEAVSQPLEPMKLADQVISPIARVTNSPALLLVGQTVNYDTLLKTLASQNLNSRYLIPIHGPEYLEELKDWNLSDFEAIFLYNYRYKNEGDFRKRPEQAWQKLEDYVKRGGRLLIETGEEVIESNSQVLAEKKLDTLPAVFPIEKTTRGDLGTKWDLTYPESSIFKEVDLDKWSDLIYEDTSWKLSYTEERIRPWAETILSQKGKPVLVEGQLGEGKVIWSGLNLPYHFLYHLNLEEAKLFENLLVALINFEREEDITTARVVRNSPEEILVSGQGFKGLILKEQAYPGWFGELLAPERQRLPVYRAGPYFIYLRLNQAQNESIKAKLVFRGSTLGWFLFSLSLATIFLVLFSLVFQPRWLRLRLVPLGSCRRKLKSWWSKDE